MRRGECLKREAAGKSKTQQGNETGEIFMRERQENREERDKESDTVQLCMHVCVREEAEYYPHKRPPS